MSGVSRQPDGAAFDIVLLLHVGCVVAGLATTITSAATASRLKRLTQRSVPLPESMGRYFAPGLNWAGRVMYGIPVFGVALVAMSHGAYSLRDDWVMSGLVLLAEGVLWPAERRIQAALAQPMAQGIPPDTAVLPGARVMARAATTCVVLLVAGSALMLAQP
jgi:hypothetical protein